MNRLLLVVICLLIGDSLSLYGCSGCKFGTSSGENGPYAGCVGLGERGGGGAALKGCLTSVQLHGRANIRAT